MSGLLKNKDDSMHEEETLFPVSGIARAKSRQRNVAGNGTVGAAGGKETGRKVMGDRLEERNVPELCGNSLFLCLRPPFLEECSSSVNFPHHLRGTYYVPSTFEGLMR